MGRHWNGEHWDLTYPHKIGRHERSSCGIPGCVCGFILDQLERERSEVETSTIEAPPNFF